MGFWGVELKPGIHTRLSFQGNPKQTLRITQAALGIPRSGTADEDKAYVECQSVGRDRTLLCTLIPGMIESCRLDLRFRQSDEAVLLVQGPRSVFLSGYYTRKIKSSGDHRDVGENGTKEEEEANDNIDRQAFASPRSPFPIWIEGSVESIRRVTEWKEVELAGSNVTQRLFFES